MSIKKGLGRSFDSLIPTELLDESFDPTAAQDNQVSDLRNIKVDQITPDAGQPRRRFDEVALADLAASIKTHGVLQPIVVTANSDGYTIVAGERRWRAAKLAGLTKIPALVRTLTDQHRLELSLIENLQRADLNPIETAMAYLKLRDQFNLTLEQVGERLGGRSHSTISNTMRLLKLPDFVRTEIVEGRLSEGQARPLIGLEPELIQEIMPRIQRESWSARMVEQYLVQLKKTNQVHAKKMEKPVTGPYQDSVKRMHVRLKAPVLVKTNARGNGQIIVKFKNEYEFLRIAAMLENSTLPPSK